MILEQPFDAAPWKRFVATLCRDAWDLDATRAGQVERDIEFLVASGDLSDAAVAQVLRNAGVTDASAGMIAPSIRVAISA